MAGKGAYILSPYSIKFSEIFYFHLIFKVLPMDVLFHIVVLSWNPPCRIAGLKLIRDSPVSTSLLSAGIKGLPAMLRGTPIFD